MTHSAAQGLMQVGIAAAIILVLAVITGWRQLVTVVPVFAVVTVLVIGMGWVR